MPMLLVLAPTVANELQALKYKPFQSKELQQIINDAAARMKGRAEITGDTLSDNSHIVFKHYFSCTPQDKVHKIARQELSQKVFTAVIDGTVFEPAHDRELALANVWALVAFVCRHCDRKKVIAVRNAYSEKYENYILTNCTLVSSDGELVMQLVEDLIGRQKPQIPQILDGYPET